MNIYRKIATDTWNRMQFASKTHTQISETTLTENLLYMINKYRESSKDNSIQIFESKNEKTHGNDLEIYLEVEKGKYVLLTIQAKKLYVKEQKYTAISHKVKHNYQIDLLINYASCMNALPLYLLYNYSPTFNCKKKELFGCTLIEALHIKKTYYPTTGNRWKIPTFNNLHKCNLIQSDILFSLNFQYAIPWHFLTNNKYFKSHINFYNFKSKKQLKEYTRDEIPADEWIEVKKDKIPTDELIMLKKDVNIKSNHDTDQYKNIEDGKFFQPKFRIVINSN